MQTIDYKKNALIIAKDVAQQIEELPSKIAHRVIPIYKDDFLIDDSKEVVANAYIASETQKTIMFGAINFNTFAQNALLKIIEEPPKNVNFIIISPSKSAILPTIRSRVPSYQLRSQNIIEPFPLELKYLNLESIFNFTKEHGFIEKEQAKRLIESLLFSTFNAGIKLRQKELELFSKAHMMLHLNERPQNIFTMLLLAILERKKRR